MLELLAKGPPTQSKVQQHQRSEVKNRDERGGEPEHGEITTKEQAKTIPASQETDYDCGEEWDDDDLLRDMTF
jgi:hypothetical protein